MRPRNALAFLHPATARDLGVLSRVPGRGGADHGRPPSLRRWAVSALVLRDCHVLDGLGGPAIEGELWIASGRIVEPGTAPVAQTERLQGKVVAPGLIDAHVHLRFWAEPDPLTAYRRTTPMHSWPLCAGMPKQLCRPVAG